jgi:two-component system nitrate/nitrite response regulator NarL
MRLVIVSEVRLYREGLAAELGRRGFEVVGTATYDDARRGWIGAQNADAALIDVTTNPHEARLADIVESAGTTKVVALGVHEIGPHVIACAEAGVAGYVPRQASLDDVVETLHRVECNEVLCPPRITGSLFRRVGVLADHRAPVSKADRLTAREREIIELIDEGLSNKQIALRLRIELSTVKNHLHNAFEKLRVGRRSEAAASVRRSDRGSDRTSASEF